MRVRAAWAAPGYVYDLLERYRCKFTVKKLGTRAAFTDKWLQHNIVSLRLFRHTLFH